MADKIYKSSYMQAQDYALYSQAEKLPYATKKCFMQNWQIVDYKIELKVQPNRTAHI